MTLTDTLSPVKKVAKNVYSHTYGTLYYAKQVDGRRKFISLETKDLSIGVRRASELAANPDVAPAKTLLDDVNRFISYKAGSRRSGYSRNSEKTKKPVLIKFCEWLPEGKKLSKITRKDIEKYRDFLQSRVHEKNNHKQKKKAKLQDSTIDGYLMTIRSFCSWAVREGFMFENPVEKVDIGKGSNRSNKPWCTIEQKDALLANAPDDQLRFILFCGFDAGLRKEEIIEARRDWFLLDHVDPEKQFYGTLHVRQAKGNRVREGERPFLIKDREQRHIPLTKPFHDFLVKFLAEIEPLDFVLFNDVKHGKARYRWDFRRPFTDYMFAQKMDWVTPHAARRSFGSILASNGISLFKIAEWLGDKESVVQDRYAHLLPGDVEIHKLTFRPPDNLPAPAVQRTV